MPGVVPVNSSPVQAVGPTLIFQGSKKYPGHGNNQGLAVKGANCLEDHPNLGYVVNNHGDRFRPLRIGLV